MAYTDYCGKTESFEFLKNAHINDYGHCEVRRRK